MLIHLHSQATTTPKVRAAIQASDEPVSVLAERFGTTEQTVYKWKHRDTVHDRSHTPNRLQTTLTPAQEAVAVVLRKTLLVSIDDLLAVVREFLNPDDPPCTLVHYLRRQTGEGYIAPGLPQWYDNAGRIYPNQVGLKVHQRTVCQTKHVKLRHPDQALKRPERG